MDKTKARNSNYYLFYTSIVGFISLILAWLLNVIFTNLPLSFEGIGYLHQLNFTWYFIDTLPIIVGIFTYYLTRNLIDDNNSLNDTLGDEKRRSQKVSDFAKEISKGNLDIEYELDEGDVLGKILVEMRDHTKNNLDDEQRRNWHSSGLATFGDLLRNNEGNIEELAYSVILQLVKYTGSNQGGIFLINSKDEPEPFIELITCYAYNRKKYEERRFEMNEGLIGQCVKEQQPIYITDVPENYVSISSGLGEANARCMILVPIIFNEETFGVIEIASFEFLEDYQIAFLEQVASNLGSTISKVMTNLHTQELLDKSRTMTEELKKVKEEDQRTNAAKLEKEKNYIQNVIDAINKTNASIEYDLDANIQDVNAMFLSVSGYSSEDLIGKNESELLLEEDRNGMRFQMMWDSLKKGSHFSGEFTFVSKEGKKLWLNGSYNPVIDSDGNLSKIIMYAQFTTEGKELSLSLSNTIRAINNAFPLIELREDRSLIKTNKEFMTLFEYKRRDIKDKLLDDLIVLKNIENGSLESVWDKLLVERSIEIELEYHSKTKGSATYSSTLTVVETEDGEIDRILLLLSNGETNELNDQDAEEEKQTDEIKGKNNVEKNKEEKDKEEKKEIEKTI